MCVPDFFAFAQNVAANKCVGFGDGMTCVFREGWGSGRCLTMHAICVVEKVFQNGNREGNERERCFNGEITGPLLAHRLIDSFTRYASGAIYMPATQSPGWVPPSS